MKKIIISILISFALINIHAQERLDINYQSIKESILKDSTYKNLLKRYEANDTTLTNKDYSIIYYGQLFQKSYSAGLDDNSRKINSFIKAKKYEKAFELCKKALQENPVSLEALYNLINCGSELNKPKEELDKYLIKYWKILNMIALTGDGKSAETGFKVICVNDEYQLMYNYFEVKGLKQQSLVNNCDVIEFTSSKYFDGTKIYFDITQVLLKEQELFTGK